MYYIWIVDIILSNIQICLLNTHSPEIFASIDPEDFAKCEWKKIVGQLPRFPSRHWRQEESRYPQYLSRGAQFVSTKMLGHPFFV
jgi:hypothetical protein